MLKGLFFANPAVLWLLLLLPVVILVYLRHQKQRWQRAFRFSALSVMEQLKRNPSPWKRLLNPLCWLLVVVLLIVAMARPTVMNRMMMRSVDMMLVMDISLSMMATDIQPDRITAAKEAAMRFVRSLPDDVRIGLTLFYADNQVVTPPTRDHRQVEAYLKEVSKEHLQQGTQIGSAIQSALNVFSMTDEADEKKQTRQAQKVLVLLSDGDSQAGYPWAVAAANARERNVIIHTVGIGSMEPATITYRGVELPVSFDEGTLRRIADIAGGEYFRVFRQEDFQTVYAKVRDKSVHYEERPDELAWLLAALALLVLAVNGMLQLFWVRRL